MKVVYEICCQNEACDRWVQVDHKDVADPEVYFADGGWKEIDGITLCPPCAEKGERNKTLVDEIIKYMVDFCPEDPDKDERTYEEYVEAVESYGVAMTDFVNDTLVKSAIRHLLYIVNLFNDAGIPEMLKDIGFTDDEIVKYYEHLYD